MTRAMRLVYKAADGLQFAVVLVGVLVVVGGLASYLATGALVALKWLLFLAGLPLLTLGVLKLRPTPAWRDAPRPGLGNSFEGGPVGRFVEGLPPVGRLGLERSERASTGTRLFLAGVLAWAVSFGMEAVVGVGVPTVG